MIDGVEIIIDGDAKKRLRFLSVLLSNEKSFHVFNNQTNPVRTFAGNSQALYVVVVLALKLVRRHISYESTK